MSGPASAKASWSARGEGERLWFLRIFRANGQVNVGPPLEPQD